MLRTLKRRFLPNPLDRMLKRCAKRGEKKILLGWNRGLGDIALGLFAIIQRIRKIVPDAEITFLTRKNLQEGFSLLQNIDVLIDPDLKRGESLKESLQIRRQDFDLIIEKPSPTDWVRWQRGSVIPRLKWDEKHEDLWKQFDLSPEVIYIGVQAVVETDYGTWRNWPLNYWKSLFVRLGEMPNVKVILFGGDEKTEFEGEHLIDLRGKTTLYELLSIVKNCCQHIILPDSGILSMVYYLDTPFQIHLMSLWADANHGILKQAVDSPNSLLTHTPLIGHSRDLSTVSVNRVMSAMFPYTPLQSCKHASEVKMGPRSKVGSIILAGGQGSRLQIKGAKGCYPVLGKSLFEWICEKSPLEDFPIAIMTSEENHDEIISFFEKRDRFGREIFFFKQGMLPFLDEETMAPSGNGSVFASFAQSGLLDQFEKRGVDLVTIVPVDNLLADPGDGALISYARSCGTDVAIQCINEKSVDEKMGALVERGGSIEIIEYHDQGVGEDYCYFNTGVMAMDLSFMREMGEMELPLHLVKKKIPGTNRWGYKRETFIFDAFSFGKVVALCDDRERCFCPIKNRKSITALC